MDKVTEKAFDKLFNDKGFIEIPKSYHAYKITSVEYLSMMAELYAKYGLEDFAPKGQGYYNIIKILNRKLAEKEITEADYDKHLKRTLKDIEEDSYYKAQQELSKTTT